MPEIVAEVESSITQREVEHTLRGMPMKKSPGPDDITTEMLVTAGDIGITELTKLANMMYVQSFTVHHHIVSSNYLLPSFCACLSCIVELPR